MCRRARANGNGEEVSEEVKGVERVGRGEWKSEHDAHLRLRGRERLPVPTISTRMMGAPGSPASLRPNLVPTYPNPAFAPSPHPVGVNVNADDADMIRPSLL